MEREIEKDLIQIESAIKSQTEKDNMFTVAVLQRCYRLVSELKEYKDLEEQGKLLKLPCAVGDTVYVIEVDEENFTHFHCPRKISEYKFNLQMLGLIGMFGKCIFLTREEATLKELKAAEE